MKMDPKRAWKYKNDNQNPYIEEQTTQWPKEKVQKDKQRSTKHTKCCANLPLLVKKQTCSNQNISQFHDLRNNEAQ